MKSRYFILMALVATMMAFTSCSSDDPFTTASEDDIPRILNPYFPDWNNGVPGEFKNFTRDINLTEEVIVTPAEYTTVTWYIDGEEVATGNSIDMPLLAGTYVLKVVARTTKGLETSRTGMVIVRPCDGDPVPGDLLFDRLVVPGTEATLHGTNMSKVTKVIINGVTVPLLPTEDGYVNIDRRWKKGDEVIICFDMEPRTVRANNKVEADRGMISIERGPLVYCAEHPDNNFDIMSALVNQDPKFRLGDSKVAGTPIKTLITEAQTLDFNKQGKLVTNDQTLTLIPYYAWCHRGSGKMRVWLA